MSRNPYPRRAPFPRATLPALGALLAMALATGRQAHAQAPEPDSGYRQPPEPIARILDTPPAPAVVVGPDRARLLFLERGGLPSIAEISAPELRLAGLRIDPLRDRPSRERLYSGLSWKRVDDAPDAPPKTIPIPPGTRVGEVAWSPDGARVALSLVPLDPPGPASLAVADLDAGALRVLAGPVLHSVLGAPFVWMPDGTSLLVRVAPPDRGPAPEPDPVPRGPLVQQTDEEAAPARTYQDLLKNAYDEALFEHRAASRLAVLHLDGRLEPLGQPGLVGRASPSPDGKYILVETHRRPFSRLVPVNRFPRRVEILDRAGQPVALVADVPLQENVPLAFDAVPVGPRSVAWRQDADAALAWVEALDDGDPAKPAEFRDRLRLWNAPFRDEPVDLFRAKFRVSSVAWSDDALAVVSESWYKTRQTRTWFLAPGNPEREPRLVFDRSSEDRYADPGDFDLARDARGRLVLRKTPDGRQLHLVNSAGATPEGNRPFLDRFDVETGARVNVWRSRPPFLETPVALLDDAGSRVLLRRESNDSPPNYYLQTLPENPAGSELPQPVKLTDFPDPAPELAGLKPEIIRYTRADGVELNAKLYLPPGYDKSQGPLPFLLWAYPREFKSAAAASQVSGSPHAFTRPAGDSHLFLLTRGYGVLDGPAMPIVGEGDAEPNDTYVEQLVASAKAAIDAIVALGVADPDRVAVGGHSYGAFMTANLLAHSDLFRAGVARSGAYNRTLTPFGFQSEERTFWQAPDVYLRMSPFARADKIKTPVLLIHGEADNNSGTFPVQSERFYAALKGHGARARFVLLPAESHGYASRESVGHVLWEMTSWLDRHLKPKPSDAPATPE